MSLGRTWTDFELVKVSSQEELSTKGSKGNPQDLSNQPQLIVGKWDTCTTNVSLPLQVAASRCFQISFLPSILVTLPGQTRSSCHMCLAGDDGTNVTV